MLRRFIERRLAAAERDYTYDMSYLRELLEVDLGAFMRFSKLRGIAEYTRDLPDDVWYAAKITGALAEDCGPCTQLVVTMAERAGVAPDTLRAVLGGDDAQLSEDVRLGVRFARAVLARSPEADALRELVVARWGKRALVTLGFALVAARVFPTLKYALGHGRTCSRVVVAGVPLAPATSAPAAVHASALA